MRFLLLLCVALSVALPVYGQANGVDKNSSRQANTSKIQSEQAQHAQPVFPVAVQRAIERVADSLDGPDAKKDAAAEHQRSERDVEAQEHMADWAPWMLGVGAAEIFLTAIGVVLLTLTYLETRSTAKDTAEELGLARKTYIATNRPRLRIRHVRVNPLVEGQPITVRYEVINVGDTRARIIDNETTVRVILVSRNRLHPAPEGIATRQFSFATEVQQGEALIATKDIATYDTAWGYDLPRWEGWWEDRLFVSGMIRYMDDNGVTRRTSFYRVATRDLNRFVVAPLHATAIADLEYED